MEFMHFAVAAADGTLRGFVDLEFTPGAEVPGGAVGISAEQWSEMKADPAAWRFARHGDGTAAFEAVPPPAPKPPAPKTLLTWNEFLGRFPEQVQGAIVVAAAQQAAQGHPELQLWLWKGAGRGEIDLADPLTAAGVRAMVDAGLVTAEQSAAALKP